MRFNVNYGLVNRLEIFFLRRPKQALGVGKVFPKQEGSASQVQACQVRQLPSAKRVVVLLDRGTSI